VGGTAGQVLTKNSATNYDTVWAASGVGTTDAAWTDVTAFTNAWASFGSPYANVGYRMVNSRVYLRGVLKSGTLNANAFVLPAGYRPASRLLFAATSANAFATVLVGDSVSGNVQVTVGAVTAVSLEGMSWDLI
jgi:hypothetical protein